MTPDPIAILDSITSTHNLQSTTTLHQQQHPAHGILYTVFVRVGQVSYQATDGDIARAHARAASEAIAALESQGYQRPRRHYRTEINNIGSRYGMRVEYADECRGPPHNCTWISMVCVGGIRLGPGVESREKGAARESAARIAVEYFESKGY
ncbi:hypothetical protein LshimejAT787_0503560 [Lyophyllum shimeji]|uniref:DRBM domain-containing protein n=1 Tax=Lyophyllum shimeji TaxID=47721 RepID=A0A9P3PNE7_LYOSH|nr:hypothetical protein LshimejAT787_0503560 [Lyophyllum shimeji]